MLMPRVCEIGLAAGQLLIPHSGPWPYPWWWPWLLTRKRH